MLLHKWRILLIPSVFEEQPPESTVALFYASVVMEPSHRQVREDLFIDGAFDHRLLSSGSFGNDRRIPWSNTRKPVNSRLFLLFQDLDPIGLNTLWPEFTPCLDGWVLK
jgi:hypothetical protein